MNKKAFLLLAMSVALCFGCTQTFSPSEEDGTDGEGDGYIPGVDIEGVDTTGWDFTGLDIEGKETMDPDLTADSVPAPPQPLFRIWLTAGASYSKSNAHHLIGGISTGDGVPSGDGDHWLIPVFRTGPAANDF